MRKNYIIILLLLLAQFGFAQIGIGTTSPTPGYDLDVNGSLLIQEEFKLSGITTGTVQDDDSKFLLRLINSVPKGEVTRLDVEQVAVAPVNIVHYTFHNLKKDNVKDVNLQFDANKYVVGLANFRYEGLSIRKSGTNRDNIGNFVSRTFVSANNMWHLEIRNRFRDAASDDAITYYVTLIVYDKKYFKQLPSIDSDLEGENNGSAPVPTEL